MASAQAAHAQQPPELLWREARRSIAAGVLVLLAAAAIFGVFVMTMPPLPVSAPIVHHCLLIMIILHVFFLLLTLAGRFTAFMQEAELSILMQNFPPKSVPAIKLVRDTVLQYANTHPVRVHAAGSPPCLCSPHLALSLLSNCPPSRLVGGACRPMQLLQHTTVPI